MGATAINPAAPPRRGPVGAVSSRLLKLAPDEKLVGLVRQGSQPAFEVVYDRHHRGILSFCRHMLGSREEAEDAVQHTFMAAYKALLGSDQDIQLRAWLYTIARNRCLSVLRARREQPSDDIELMSIDGLAAEVQRRDDLREMLADLADLPADQREALVLSELGDLGHDEIAAILDVPKDKVKALVFQARSSLHQSRDARETSCQEIQEMLATLSGGSLRRTTLRRHIKGCTACQAFEADVKRQRRAMAAVLPVVPTLGLKESVLANAFSQTAAAGGVAAAGGAAVAGGVLSGGGASAIVAKVLVVATVAGGGAAGVSAVSNSNGGGDTGSRPTPANGPGPSGTAPVPAATVEVSKEQDAKVEQDKPAESTRGKADRGTEFAKTRGKGKKRGLDGTQPGKTKTAKVEKKKARAERAKGREKAAEQKARAKAKAKANNERPAKTAPKKPAKPDPAPRAPEPKPDPKPTKPEPTPEPTPEATVAPVPTPTPGKKD